MSFQSLPQLLNTVTNQENWRERQQFQQLVICWFEIVGAAVAAQTRPIAIQRQVLQVATSSSAWAQNLAFERHRILDKLNLRLGQNFTDIRFSAAHWQSDFQRNGVENSSETVILWREHPSRVAPVRLPRVSPPPIRDPQAAFLNWARTVRAQSQHLPLCPCCHSPTPDGELARWSICALCAAQQFGQAGRLRAEAETKPKETQPKETQTQETQPKETKPQLSQSPIKLKSHPQSQRLI